ncbi:stAR-related lipid transfer protein 13 isoform X2 [Clupea harengus]|uniref:StAR-related lipid transfer protein 13 n=1 Tax=Clupea harengus TaxID=7950 RepID=A0A6P8FNI4_CLUHA|nr:stAR-related lipid transfer protein 13 isoform X2 [Clupea harengus]
MTTKRKSAKLQLRRSISEQLRDSTSKAWDLLWRNVRERRLAEIEAKEACDWLRAAGFPQYAQLYEDTQFPIDILAVKRDHDFLDKDLVEPLCRRLNTLNKCASMKLDVSPPKKRSEDSDEDDVLAISNRWTFEWSSRRWSRLQDIDQFLGSDPQRRSLSDMGEDSGSGGVGSGLRPTVSSESVLTDLSEPEVCSLHSEDSASLLMPDSFSLAPSPGAHTQSQRLPGDFPHYHSLPAKVGSGGGGGGRHGRTKAKDFLRRMETLRSWGSSLGRPDRRSLVISGPVLQSEPDALRTLRCVQIANGESLPIPPLYSTLPRLRHSTQVNGCAATLTLDDGGVSRSESTAGGADSAAISEDIVGELQSKQMDLLSKRGGIYLEGMDVLTSGPETERTDNLNNTSTNTNNSTNTDAITDTKTNTRTPTTSNRPVAQSRRTQFRSYDDLVVHVPKDHKPGTFPKALSIESLAPASCETGNWRAGETQTRGGGGRPGTSRTATRCCPHGSRISVYDNVPGSHLYASTGDLLDLEKEDLFPHLDDILQHVNGLQQIVDHWSRNVLPPDGEGEGAGEGHLEEEEDEEGEGEGTVMKGVGSASQITLDIEGLATASDGERDGVSLNDTDSTSTRERRDSGVGASLTRPRLRWPSFRISNRLSQAGVSLQINSQSAGQLSLLQKFSLLRLTAIMEKYSMSNKHGWTWSVPKFMKRMKGPEYKEKAVFGVPLVVQVQRHGQPLPLCIQLALRFLRSQCLDQVGLFRKSGAKSRILALRQMCETSPDAVDYEDQSAYDVADMVKQFFRDLPEPLLTSKMGETFLHIYQYVPKEQRLQAVQAAIMLMADESREVLQTLLCFLSDVTSSVEENQMTPMNLAVCLAPSLFHLNIMKNDNLSPRSIQKKYATGRPDQKDLNENLAATQGLSHMIMECNSLFEIPQEMVAQSRNSYVEAELLAPPLDEVFKQQQHQQHQQQQQQLQEEEEEDMEEEGSYHSQVERLIQSLLKESRDKTKGWVSRSSMDNTELAFRKVGDGTPLRRWRVSVEVEAPPSVVLNRILRERHLWDSDLLQWKVLETLDKQTEVYQYALNSMAPHPSRDFVVLRSWRTDMQKGVCTLVAISVDHEDSPPMGGVRGVVLESQYLLEPCGSGKSRLTHICRIDLKGLSPEWYNKAFGHLCSAEAARIRDSFQSQDSDGPETKI